MKCLIEANLSILRIESRLKYRETKFISDLSVLIIGLESEY